MNGWKTRSSATSGPFLKDTRHEFKFGLPGDILFCHTNSQRLVGKTAFFNLKGGKYAFSNHLTRLRPSKDESIPDWIWYGLTTLWLETRCRQWVNQATVVKEDIPSAPIPLPPLEEQKRIINRINELFSETKVAKESIGKLQPILKNLRESSLVAGFMGKLTEREPNHEPAGKLLERIRSYRKKERENLQRARRKESNRLRYDQELINVDNLQKLPEGWIWAKSGDIYEGIVPGRNRPKEFTGHIPWITLPDVDGMYVSRSKKILLLQKKR